MPAPPTPSYAGAHSADPAAAERLARDQPPKRTAEGEVSRAPAASGATGPGAAQEQNQYSADILRFPPDVGDSPKHIHWIKFTPCIQQMSKYQISVTNELSSADVNRAGGSGAGAKSPISTGAALTSGFAGGTLSAVIEAGKTALKGGTGAGTKAIGAGLKTFGASAAAGAALTQVDMTRKTRRSSAYICLYMPDTVLNSFTNDYDAVSLTEALGKAGLNAGVASSLATGAQKAVGVTTGAGGGGAVTEYAAKALERTKMFGEGAVDVALFSGGLAQNPQVELLFKNINNREFQFDFKFVPREPGEAITILNIIKTFRFHAAPEIPTAGQGRYFIPPSEFDIEFSIGGGWNPRLPKISTCVLQGVDVNYGSAGQWTAFQDGMPVEITMILKFKEVEILHKDLIAQGY